MACEEDGTVEMLPCCLEGWNSLEKQGGHQKLGREADHTACFGFGLATKGCEGRVVCMASNIFIAQRRS